jgi:hypothetical protein
MLDREVAQVVIEGTIVPFPDIGQRRPPLSE